MTFEQFRQWVDTIDQRLDAKTATATTTLARYADATAVPADPTARHLLLDVDGTEFTRASDASGEKSLDFDGVATTVRD